MVGISRFWIQKFPLNMHILLGGSSQVESAKIILRSHHGLRYACVPPSRSAENWLRQMRTPVDPEMGGIHGLLILSVIGLLIYL